MGNILDADLGQLTAAELPPTRIGALAVGTVDLLLQASDLPQPHYVTISATGHIDLQFTPDKSGAAAISKWATRFGGVLTNKPIQHRGAARILCKAQFDYCGVHVGAYAIVPAGTATT